MKVLLAVNPISGGVDKEPFLKYAKEHLDNYGIEYSIFKTTGKDDEVNLQKAVEEFKPDRVASLGGDGTTLFSALTLRDRAERRRKRSRCRAFTGEPRAGNRDPCAHSIHLNLTHRSCFCKR